MNSEQVIEYQKKIALKIIIQTIRFEDFYGQNIVDFHKN